MCTLSVSNVIYHKFSHGAAFYMTLSVSNVIYHKFSHGVAFYTLNGKNVNVILEFMITTVICGQHIRLLRRAVRYG